MISYIFIFKYNPRCNGTLSFFLSLTLPLSPYMYYIDTYVHGHTSKDACIYTCLCLSVCKHSVLQ